MNLFRKCCIAALLFGYLAGCSTPKENPPQDSTEKSTLSIQFFDVGQGDAVLVECDGKAMLIDGGDKSVSQKMYAVLKEKQLNELEYVVASSLSDEHVGGLAGALNYASSKETLVGKLEGTTDAFHDFKKYADKNGGGLKLVKAGDVFKIGSAELEVLAVEDTKGLLLLKLTFMETSVLIVPDCTQDEMEMFADSLNGQLESTVLKVADHGQDRAASVDFLKKADPEYAVISSNGYQIGETSLSLLDMASVELYRTDLHGDITLKSDGKTITFETKKQPDASEIYAALKTAPSDSDDPQPTSEPSSNPNPASTPTPTPTPTSTPIATPTATPTPTSTPQSTADSSLKVSVDEIYEANLLTNLVGRHGSVKTTSVYGGTSYISGAFMVGDKIATLYTMIQEDGTCSYNGWYDGYNYYDNGNRVVMTAFVEELGGDKIVPGQQDIAWFFQYDEEVKYEGKKNNMYQFSLDYYGTPYTLYVDCDSLALMKVEWKTGDGTDGYEYVYGEWIPGQDIMNDWTNGSGLKMVSVYADLFDGNETKSLYRPFYLPLRWELEVTSAMYNLYSYLDPSHTVPYIYPGDEISFELYVTNAAG